MDSQPRWPIVLFDLDGTLANTINAIVASFVYTYDTTLGRKVERAQILPWIGRTLADVFSDEAPERADELEQVYMEHNIAHLESLVTGFEGIPQLLTDLDEAGVQTGIVTAKRRESAIPTMVFAGLPPTIQLLCAKQDTETHKPDPAPLLWGLRVLEAGLALPSGPVSEDNCCYVGDATYDLQAAHAAKMAGVGVTWGAGKREDLVFQPNAAIVDTVDQLRALLLP